MYALNIDLILCFHRLEPLINASHTQAAFDGAIRVRTPLCHVYFRCNKGRMHLFNAEAGGLILYFEKVSVTFADYMRHCRSGGRTVLQ
jgi:hypothetical protein